MIPLLALVSSLSFATPASAVVRFSGGMCASQGSWLQSALRQSRSILDVLESLRNDPACKALVHALEKAPKIQEAAQTVGKDEHASFANSYREITALGDFLNPKASHNSTGHPAFEEQSKKFQEALVNVVFNKSFEELKDLNSSSDLAAGAESGRQSQRNMSPRLMTFLQGSKSVANATMETSRGILAALPESQDCLHNHPSAAMAVFGSIIHTSAALVSGGTVNGVGEFTASLLNFSNEMKYSSSRKQLLTDEFKNSVSCLVESTSEAYCALQDAEDSLEMMRSHNGGRRKMNLHSLILNAEKDPVASPLAGLVIYMRDIPVVQAWLQKILFGMSPRTAWQGNGKNDNWTAYLDFIKSVNTIQANFFDKQQLYLMNSEGRDRTAKLSSVRRILEDALIQMRGGFYANAVDPSVVPFYLLGLEKPEAVNGIPVSLETVWDKNVREGTNNFDNPDRLLETIRSRIWALVDKAQVEANTLFAKRMIVDPQNLVTEAMRGPGVSPYQAFLEQRTYYANLIEKLRASAAVMEDDPSQKVRRAHLVAHVPVLQDSVRRLDNVIEALQQVAQISPTDGSPAAVQSEKVMDVVYAAANMIVSWDSFFGTRMQTALQADLSDTIWRKAPIEEKQREYLMSAGPEIIGRLAGFFSSDPVAARTDLSAAKAVHITNVKVVEQQFSATLFNEILDIGCKLEGGYFCEARSMGLRYNPASRNPLERKRVEAINAGIRNYREGGSAFNRRVWNPLMRFLHPVSEDSKALSQLRAKYCAQALGFESRGFFREACRGAVLESDFADARDSAGLNMSFDEQLEKIEKVLKSGERGKIDNARNMGVCSLRRYLRKNHVYFMYSDYNDGK